MQNSKLRIAAFLPDDNYYYGWLMNDCVDVLHALGHCVEPRKTSESEKVYRELESSRGAAYDFIFTIGFIGIGPEYTGEYNVPHVGWFVDDPMIMAEQSPSYFNAPHTYPLCWDRMYCDYLESKGATNVFHLPLGTNPEVFKNIDLTDEQRKMYGCHTSFVGNSLQYASLSNDPRFTNLSPERKEFMQLVTKLQCQMPDKHIHDVIEHACRSEAGFSGMSISDTSARIKLELALRGESNRIQRCKFVSALADKGIHVYGDDGWKNLETEGVSYRGKIDYRTELPLLYNATEVNINVTHLQMVSGLPARIYDAFACGALILTDYRSDLDEVLGPEARAITYRDERQLAGLVDFYTARPDERAKMASLFQERILANHTLTHRMNRLLAILPADGE